MSHLISHSAYHTQIFVWDAFMPIPFTWTKQRHSARGLVWPKLWRWKPLKRTIVVELELRVHIRTRINFGKSGTYSSSKCWALASQAKISSWFHLPSTSARRSSSFSWTNGCIGIMDSQTSLSLFFTFSWRVSAWLRAWDWGCSTGKASPSWMFYHWA